MNDSKERPAHLRVIGTRISEPQNKSTLITLLGDVPLEWDFETPAGEKMLAYVHEQVEDGHSIDDLAELIGMGSLPTLYAEWVGRRG